MRIILARNVRPNNKISGALGRKLTGRIDLSILLGKEKLTGRLLAAAQPESINLLEVSNNTSATIKLDDELVRNEDKKKNFGIVG